MTVYFLEDEVEPLVEALRALSRRGADENGLQSFVAVDGAAAFRGVRHALEVTTGQDVVIVRAFPQAGQHGR